MTAEREVLVVGAGPAGLVAALAVAKADIPVTLIAPGIGASYSREARARDTRTTALLGGSVDFLSNLGLRSQLESELRPLKAIRIVDQRGGPIRAPELLFRADEIGCEAFGYNVANAALIEVLHKAAVGAEKVELVPGLVTAVELGADAVAVATEGGDRYKGSVLAAADGRVSLARKAAGIAVDSQAYPQSAIAVTVTHRRPHQDISTEFHRPAGPLTTVPSPDTQGQPSSSIVWVETPAEVDRLMALPDSGFVAELSSHLGTVLGPLELISKRASFPLMQMRAREMARRRVMLIGEAGHVVPPIGAQGLNLGFRDAATFAEVVAGEIEAGRDAGGEAAVAAYKAARAADVASRALMTDVLNRSLLSDFVPVQALRGLGLQALASLGPLRRLAMRVGMEPPGERPRLMRPAGQ